MKKEYKERENLLVSVVMPVYNTGEYLIDSISSILNQTYSNIELVIVDSSTDERTISLIDKENPKIKYYWIEKNGIANALNYGIDRATGEFIARMDADDISHKERIEKQVEYMINNEDVMVLGTNYITIDENGNVLNKLNHVVPKSNEMKTVLIFGNAFCHPSVMFRREVFECGYRYDGKYYAEDFNLWTRLALNYKMSNLNDNLLFYRYRKESASHSQYYKVEESAAKSRKEYLENLFGIDLEDFGTENMFSDIKYAYRTITPSEYAINQAKLLYIIYMANKKGKYVDDMTLIYELNLRCKLVFSVWGDYEFVKLYNDGVQYIHDSLLDTKKFFMEQLADKLNCGLEDEKLIIDEITKEIVEINDDFHAFILNDSIRYVIYGVGIRGKEFIDGLNSLNDNEIFRWRLVSIADKKKTVVNIGQDVYETVLPTQIKDLCFDYIVITSNIYYEEIRNELIELGIPASKIINGNALYWIKSYSRSVENDNY